MTYREALAWLYATQKFGIKLGLENTQRLLRTLRVEKLGRIIHVAGTNGKGSVCAMIDAICQAAGYRSGLFTSPHLISFRERIRVNGEMITEGAIADGLSAIRDLVRQWETHPTFFEITTALALQHLQQAQCEIIVLETGMGGRLDATNAVTADVSVITPIDFDHQKWLGNSLAEIAAEKAGIIKQAVPVISAGQQKAAAKVIADRAADCGAPLQFVNEPRTASDVALPGAHQKLNAAVAVAAIGALDSSIPEDVIARALRSVAWPARFQIWDERIVIDGAHNPAGARALVQTWREQFRDENATVVLGVLRDKEVAEIISILSPIAARFVLPRIRSERAIPAAELSQLISSIIPLVPHSLAMSTADAISQALAQSNRILITGSLHFAGEALAQLRGTSNSLEDCAQ